MAVVSKRLGHSSIAITSDTHSHLLEGVGRSAANAAARLSPRLAKSNSEDPCDYSVTSTVRSNDAEEGTDGIVAGQGVGRLGIEPRTRGLKEWGARSQCVATDRSSRCLSTKPSECVAFRRHESLGLATRLATQEPPKHSSTVLRLIGSPTPDTPLCHPADKSAQIALLSGRGLHKPLSTVKRLSRLRVESRRRASTCPKRDPDATKPTTTWRVDVVGFVEERPWKFYRPDHSRTNAMPTLYRSKE
jgi:hypothetical protein